MTKEFLQTLFVRSTVLIRAAVAMAVRQNLAKATTSPERGLGRPLTIVVAILKSRHLRGPITTKINPLDLATMGRDNRLGTIVATMDSSVIALRIKIVQIIQTTVTRIKIEISLVIIDYENRQYNNNSMSKSNFNFQNSQGYNSRGNQNYEGFNQDSSSRFQNNDQDLEQSSSQSSIYTKYLELQIRMLQQTSTLQSPSINSDEFSASQSCSSNSSQLGYIQTTPSLVTTRPVVAPQGPSSSNELGN